MSNLTLSESINELSCINVNNGIVEGVSPAFSGMTEYFLKEV